MRYIKLYKYIIIAVCLLLPTAIFAQQVAIKASIDSTTIMIGQQTMIRLEVAGNKDQQLKLPVFSDTIITGIEIVETFPPDTADIGNNRIQIKQNYLITSFDSALYLLPPFEIVSGGDTTYSTTLGLKVMTLQVDTESKQFYDIKNVIDPKFVFADYLWIVLGILGMIALGVTGWYFYKRWKEKKSLIPFKKTGPPLPAHIKAINELNQIKAQKLWQMGRIKEYHSLITDTLRIYIEGRFNTPAMEMTSNEILGKIRHLSDVDSVYENLKQILLLSDFVKFAKFQPLPDENELSLMNAYLFVNQTKEEEKTILPDKNVENRANDDNIVVFNSNEENDKIEKNS